MYVVCTVHVPCGDRVRRLGTTCKHWGLKLNNKITESSRRESDEKAMRKSWKYSKLGWMKHEQKERSLQELVRRIRIQIQCKGIERAARDNSTTSRRSRGVVNNEQGDSMCGTKQERLRRRQVYNEQSDWKCWAKQSKKDWDSDKSTTREERLEMLSKTKQASIAGGRRRQVTNEQTD